MDTAALTSPAALLQGIPPLELVSGAVLLVLAVATALPQAIAVLRSGNLAGVSMASLLNGTVSTVAWLGWSVAGGYTWVAVCTVAGIPATALLWIAAVRAGARFTVKGIVLPAVWAAVLLCATAVEALTDVAALTFALGSSLLWFLAPAVTEAWRSPDVSGISAGSWWLSLLGAATSFTYGLAAGVDAEVIYGSLLAVGTAAVLVRLVAAQVRACLVCAQPSCACPA